MDNPSLTKKRKINTPDGEMLDLSAPTVRADVFLNIVENMHFVAEEEAMRLDNIANRYYGWSDKLDAILWANNIFNPFSIDAGDWLIIPRVKDTNMYVKNPDASKMPDDENSRSTSSKITSAANKLNNANKNAKSNKRKTNELAPGETHKKFDGGLIRLG